MVIKQYPYTLYVWKLTEAVLNEDTGEWEGGTEEWVEVSKCRDEANGGGQKIVTTDGQIYVFGAVIQMPKNSPSVQIGAKVKVLDKDGNVRLEAENKLWKKEQLHSRLWV